MAVEKRVFGKARGGEEVLLYTIKNEKGMEVWVSELGAAIVKIIVPDKQGKPADVVLGFDRPEDYYKGGCLGEVVGPNANRIGGASFVIDGETYHIQKNEGENNLHSHSEKGYQYCVWETTAISDNSVTFAIEDADGNMGFPGNKKVQVTYTLDEENALTLHYHGDSDKKTVLNLTNHVYFNLDGHDSGNVEGHELWMDADYFTPAVDSIPTGEFAAVAGTPMDFKEAKTIGRDIRADFEQLLAAGGYDHNWVIAGWDGQLKHFATLKAPVSGRVMKVYTTLPGVQLYTGNFLNGEAGKDGAVYQRRAGLCLETQYFPDGVHHENFPSSLFGGQERPYDSVTVFRFE